jgi:hypothetical protein
VTHESSATELVSDKGHGNCKDRKGSIKFVSGFDRPLILNGIYVYLSLSYKQQMAFMSISLTLVLIMQLILFLLYFMRNNHNIFDESVLHWFYCYL